MEPEQLFALVFVMGMFAGVVVILMAMRQRSYQLEMQHRERMAMIERGLTAQPELSSAQRFIQARGTRGAAASRSMTLGIVVVAVGLALMSIVSIAAGEPDVGLGIGGAIMIVGIAFIVNSIVSRNQASAAPDTLPAAPPIPPGDRVE